MYKRTSDRQSFLARTASHATKPSAFPGIDKCMDFVSDSELENFDLLKAREYRQSLLSRLSQLEQLFEDGKRTRYLSQEKARICSQLTLAKRIVASLSKKATLLSDKQKWQLALRFILPDSLSARVEVCRLAIGWYINKHGFPPESILDLDEYLLEASEFTSRISGDER